LCDPLEAPRIPGRITVPFVAPLLALPHPSGRSTWVYASELREDAVKARGRSRTSGASPPSSAPQGGQESALSSADKPS
jgi:hypothetical protein